MKRGSSITLHRPLFENFKNSILLLGWASKVFEILSKEAGV
jgi:hypothetical protein